jgi:hypothetical protein
VPSTLCVLSVLILTNPCEVRTSAYYSLHSMQKLKKQKAGLGDTKRFLASLKVGHLCAYLPIHVRFLPHSPLCYICI